MEPTSNPALNSMHDIQTPDVITSMPIAMGYWLVLAIVSIAIIFFVVKLRKEWLKRAVKREVLAQLNALAVTQDNATEISVQINSLIKRAAMSYLSREQIAGLQGGAWYLWMDRQVKSPSPRLTTLLDRRYQRAGLNLEEANELKTLAENWFKQALPLSTISTKKCNQDTKEAQC
ncbi:DUF4381 domain-containing protein [Shewanella eurypsychrophilus]|uniref:DUF4381 domain-containing protein n=1 Tax=Shewanella eurypsychrophilus TaxID=2593656 RepID=A0ABX6V4A2_9GAMM|nr:MULTISPECIES: DUF4381 domain-containing protein [Shewanella]QFU22138.1 DUF4381 family protein [Shewanella sp. YLB-09]QPG57426.1 DUF4381 domain-containing protein [Shewanella eurypsychrophilus]